MYVGYVSEKGHNSNYYIYFCYLYYVTLSFVLVVWGLGCMWWFMLWWLYWLGSICLSAGMGCSGCLYIVRWTLRSCLTLLIHQQVSSAVVVTTRLSPRASLQWCHIISLDDHCISFLWVGLCFVLLGTGLDGSGLHQSARCVVCCGLGLCGCFIVGQWMDGWVHSFLPLCCRQLIRGWLSSPYGGVSGRLFRLNIDSSLSR